MNTKIELFSRGVAHMREFCAKNDLEAPPVRHRLRENWIVGACAYYRPVRIEICIDACAAIGHAGRQWSYPGYTVDRTPFGVIAHELGHHADVTRSATKRAYFGDYSVKMRAASGESPLTSYCPNDAEWFAEMFRLFVTNPDLLRLIKPRTYRLITVDFQPLVADPWGVVLRAAPVRTIAAAQRKVEQACALPLELL